MTDGMSLTDFVRESNRIEGITRTTQAHIEAHRRLVGLPMIVIDDLMDFVAIVQPNARYRANPNIRGVRVGNHIAPSSGPHIEVELERVLTIADPWEQHVAYETLHPFTDGNGRSGRALWLHRHGGHAPIGFLHAFYYQTLQNVRAAR